MDLNAKPQPQAEPKPSQTGAEAGPKGHVPGAQAPGGPLDLWRIDLSADKQGAFLVCKEPGAPLITVQQVKDLLKANLVSFGVAGDKDLAQAVEAASHGKPAQVAAGVKPQLGSPRYIQYMFDTDPLKVGTIKEGGELDFRDRGEIPQVRKGDVIAMVVEGEPGQTGRDVLGELAPPPKLESTTAMVRVGKGASKSEDGKSVVAATDGRPVVTADGRLFVFPGHVVNGDVGLETGHVRFEGSIEVKGVVQDGFEVTGGSLTAKEVGRARIETKGDVVVLGGVIGARIQAGGSVRARHVYGSTIDAVGDVIIEKQVLDSRVITSGAFLIPRGKILSSGVCAKMGVEAKQVGSDSSKPCTLLVGVDEHFSREMDRMREEIKACEERIKKRELLLEEIHQAQATLQANIGKLAQVQDRAMVATRDLEERIQKGEGDVSGMKMRVMAIRQQTEKVGETLELLVSKQEAVYEDRNRILGEKQVAEAKLEELKAEIEYFTALDKEKPGSPVLKCQGTVFSGTSIKGMHSVLSLAEDSSFVKIREIHTVDENEKPIWRMEVSRQGP